MTVKSTNQQIVENIVVKHLDSVVSYFNAIPNSKKSQFFLKNSNILCNYKLDMSV